MRDILKMMIVLTLIGAASGLALSVIHSVTEGPIEYQTIKFVKEPAVKKVLTGYDNDPIGDRKKIVVGTDDRGNPVELNIFPAKKGGNTFAVALEGKAKGFHGDIGVMVGVNENEKILDIAITSHSETPGVGSKVTESFFTEGFKGLSLKPDIQVDAISGATYSSKGVMAAVEKVAGYVKKHKQEIF